MYNKSKAKGTKAENDAKAILIKHTGLKWLRTPLSGALSEEHGLKSDLYIPQCKNKFAIEVKHYKDNHINHTLLTGKNPQIEVWWKQTKREAKQNDAKPLLIFKFDRSKFFCAFEEKPKFSYRYLKYSGDINTYYISLLEDWLKNEEPVFV